MPQVVLYAALLCFFHSYAASSSSCNHTVAPPSHGDLWWHSDTDGLVLIYMGPDGTDYPHMWGTLSTSGMGRNVYNTLCNQLGYAEGNLIHSKSKYRGPVWLSRINCPPATKHILRCSYTFNSSLDHSNDIHLRCSQISTRFRSVIETKDDANTYDGQAALLPPKVAADCNRSRSYGAVMFKHYNKVWKYLYYNYKYPLSQDATDTICREIGYTHSVPNSLWTIGQVKDGTNDTNITTYKFDLSAGLNFSTFSCRKAFPCIGCNYSLSPKSEDIQKTATPTEKMHQDDAMILRCSFYSGELSPGKKVSDGEFVLPGGNRSYCDMSKGSIKNTPVCSIPDPMVVSKGEFYSVAIVPSCVLLFIIVLVLCKVYRKYCGQQRERRGYNPLQGHNVNRPLREAGQDGGNGGNGAENGRNGGEDGGDGGNGGNDGNENN